MASLADYKPLRLMAGDQEDLKVLSACLQDAVAKLGDFAWLPEEKRFAFVVNRFVWECAGGGRLGAFARVRTGIHFDDVTAAKFSHLRTDAKDAVIELLSVTFEPGEDAAGEIVLHFAGGGAIRLSVESVNAWLSDISDPWRTRARPEHDA